MTTPLSTYRLQVRPEFGFADVADVAAHLAALGVTHAYLSPILQATPGSQHGYDVVDHTSLSAEAGGREAFDAMALRLRENGLAAIADVVPNHMAVPSPLWRNSPLWSVLAEGPSSPYADWFDVDRSVFDGQLLLPVLGQPIGDVLAAGELSVDGEHLMYFDHVFPLRSGTASLPLPELLAAQWYRLAWWRVADEELNYRRFFDVKELIAVRVEDPAVFEATHALIGELIANGSLTGLRIDHPDGLADPRGYLRDLASLTDGAWVVVEKILEGAEELPDDWPCAGTTGYDALWRIGGLFLDAQGAEPLTDTLTELTGSALDLPEIVEDAKRSVATGSLVAEVSRMTALLHGICERDLALRDHSPLALRSALVELLVAMDRYRAYVVPGEKAPEDEVSVVVAAAGRARPHLGAAGQASLDVVVDLVLGRAHPLPSSTASDVLAVDEAARAEVVTRFGQTCGPVMAKGIEDTAFYRWFRLSSLNEVGGDAERVGVPPAEFHAYAQLRAATWPGTMTTLSTHDTKRSEDVRARLGVLSELPEAWGRALRTWRQISASSRVSVDSGPSPDASTEYLFWQTLVGTWSSGPIALDRLLPYLTKAMREAKNRTTWTDQDTAYEEGVEAFVRSVLGDTGLMGRVRQFCDDLAPAARVATLGQKLVQLTMPGVPDVYQGSELVDLSLVDPDNRREVDFGDRRHRLAALDAGRAPADLSDEKLLITSRALRLRRENPAWYGPGGAYSAVESSSEHVVAFGRGPIEGPTGTHAITVATRLPVSLEASGGWRGATLTLPSDAVWTDILTGHRFDGGPIPLSGLLTDLPVALLIRS